MPTALKMNILLLPSLLVLIKILSKVKHLICHIYPNVILSEAKNLWRLKVAISTGRCCHSERSEESICHPKYNEESYLLLIPLCHSERSEESLATESRLVILRKAKDLFS